jgi:ABC-type transport system substrate-binding protein
MSPQPDELPTAEAAAGDKILRGPSSAYTFVGLPVYAPGLDDVDVRRALSMAIDRQAIIDNVLSGVGTPADDSISPAVPGYEAGSCEYCTYDPEAAKALYDQSGGLPDDTLELFFNADAGHEAWMEAVANQWFNNLGIEVKQSPVEWADHLDKIGVAEEDPENAADNPDTIKGAFRLGWLMDYPSPENYLRPLYDEGRYVAWINEGFSAKLQEGDALAPEEAVAVYREAADIVLDEMPFIPISYGESIRIWSDNVTNVNYDITKANPVFEEIEVVQQ